uniref:Uncharacterized protein n=1 Tax=viral metagenome TaxID=1070528 RepID=A0A6M3IKT3_9ZZZZ
MRRLTTERVAQDNPHMDWAALRYRDDGVAQDLDPWADQRGYRQVRTYTDGQYEATYGYHVPTGEWHLWAN